MITTLLLIAAQGVSATTPLTCPDHITTNQSLAAPVAAEWHVSSNTFSVADDKLSGGVYGFTSGPAEEMALLAPNSTLKNKDGLLSTWLMDSTEQTWLICGYDFTTIQLSKPLPRQFKKCFLQTDKNGDASAWCE